MSARDVLQLVPSLSTSVCLLSVACSKGFGLLDLGVNKLTS